MKVRYVSVEADKTDLELVGKALSELAKSVLSGYEFLAEFKHIMTTDDEEPLEGGETAKGEADG